MWDGKRVLGGECVCVCVCVCRGEEGPGGDCERIVEYG